MYCGRDIKRLEGFCFQKQKFYLHHAYMYVDYHGNAMFAPVQILKVNDNQFITFNATTDIDFNTAIFSIFLRGRIKITQKMQHLIQKIM